jgi:protein TonB
MTALTMWLAVLIVGGPTVEGQIPKESGRDIPPKVVMEVKPVYPSAALADGIEGFVGLECTVREDGTVGDARVIAPVHPELDAAALRALAQWRFLPARKGGKPVPFRINVEISVLRPRVPQAPNVFKGPPLDSPDVFAHGGSVSMPVVLSERKPSYTATAMRAKVEGSVKMECVVLPDGTVGEVRVMKRLDPDIDGEAVRALRDWTFKPGMKDGVAVPVRVEIEMTFTLR